jgi:hypothetical protein
MAYSSPTDQKPSIAPIFVHSSPGVECPKEKPAGAGGIVFLTRGKREVVVPVRGEAKARQEVAVGASRGIGGAMRGNATPSWCKCEGSVTRRDTTTRQHFERQWCASSCCGATRSHATTNLANGRQWCVERWYHIMRKRQCNNQPGEKRGIGASRGSGMTRGDAAWTNK